MEDRMKWWREAKFGMFIHWGIYSIPARGEWVMFCERIPKEEYKKFAKKFNPKNYNPGEWAQIAKEGGMKYIVLTTRHHDGFSLFDSKVSDFTAPKYISRDLIAEYVDSCRKFGLKIGFYYSLCDWRYDAFFNGHEKDPSGWKELVDYVHTQVRELMTNYGEIDILWYDGPGPYKPEHWQSEKLDRMVRELQPQIIINDRSLLPEDFSTPEQHIEPTNRDWEACMTLNDHWGYCKYDNNYKTPKQVVINLVRCASYGGNYLLNVSPKPDGKIPVKSKKILKEVGKWLKIYGESVYGTERTNFEWHNFHPGIITKNGNKLYLHIFYWFKEFAIGNLKIDIKNAYFLKEGIGVDFEVKYDRIVFKNLPEKPPDPIDTVIVLEYEGEIEKINSFRPF
ncbi:MAG: alpha-L-fucosidase [Candidatus Omnitrophica bacterium]|nr:alpha-L-fucosidase [Candidatus Omnitrophota bacterium]